MVKIRNGRFMDDVYLSADKYIEYTSEQADNIMQMKLGKDYDNYIVYEADNNPERLFTHNGEEFYITSIEESEDE